MSDFDFLYGGNPPYVHIPIPADGDVVVLIGMTAEDGVRGFLAQTMTREAFLDMPMGAVLRLIDQRAEEMIRERSTRDRGTEGG